MEPFIQDLLKRLRSMTRTLTMLGQGLAFLVVVELVAGALIAATFQVSRLELTRRYVEEIGSYSVGFAVIGLVMLALFDSVQRRGKALFDEIAIDQHSPSPDSEDSNLPKRLALREFAASTDLPFVHGHIGFVFYTIANALALFAGVWRAATSFYFN